MLPLDKSLEIQVSAEICKLQGRVYSFCGGVCEKAQKDNLPACLQVI